MDTRLDKIKRFRSKLSLTGAIVATAVGVLLPVILSTSVGIVAIAIGKSSELTIIGVLVISFAAAAIGGAVVVTVLLSRRHRLARMQSDFLANVTHELRTPLTSIRLYAQTLQMQGNSLSDDVRNKSINTILRETHWLETMIDRVLTWRAAERDRYVPNMQDATLVEAVNTALERFSYMISNEETEIVSHMENELKVHHDKSAVESIAINLLTNAYKYSSAPREIHIELNDVDDGVQLQVIDNGVGIPKSDQKKIFDPFFRADSKLSSKASGAGLGLAIVQYQVQLHHGTVSVDSEEGKGTAVSVMFPAVDALAEGRINEK
jgi:two-component system phosphate regulon sensor histidine kinase PhoR